MQGLTVACYREIVAAGSPECQCVCVKLCVKWWERKGRGCKCLSSMITLSSPSSRQSTQYINMQHGCGRQILSVEWRYALSNFDRKQKKRIPANQDVTDCLPKLFEQPIVAVSVHEKKFFCLWFFKKSGKSFLRKRKVKKKSELRWKAEDWHPCIIANKLHCDTCTVTVKAVLTGNVHEYTNWYQISSQTIHVQ